MDQLGLGMHSERAPECIPNQVRCLETIVCTFCFAPLAQGLSRRPLSILILDYVQSMGYHATCKRRYLFGVCLRDIRLRALSRLPYLIIDVIKSLELQLSHQVFNSRSHYSGGPPRSRGSQMSGAHGIQCIVLYPGIRLVVSLAKYCFDRLMLF